MTTTLLAVVTWDRVLDHSALLSSHLFRRQENLTHLSGLGCCDINVTQYTRSLPGLSPSVHAYSLAQCARDKAQRGPKSREEEDVPDVLLSVKLLPDPCTQTRSVVPTAILGPLLCQALRRILSTASSGLLLSVLFGTDVCM